MNSSANVLLSRTRFAHFPSYRIKRKAWLPSALPSRVAAHLKDAKLLESLKTSLVRCVIRCKGVDAYLEFLRVTVLTAKGKEADVGSSCPFFQTKGGCPFAKDTKGKPILSPDYIVVCSCLHLMQFRSNMEFLLLVPMEKWGTHQSLITLDEKFSMWLMEINICMSGFKKMVLKNSTPITIALISLNF